MKTVGELLVEEVENKQAEVQANHRGLLFFRGICFFLFLAGGLIYFHFGHISWLALGVVSAVFFGCLSLLIHRSHRLIVHYEQALNELRSQ